MNRIKYNAEIIKLMSLFETVTNSKLKDCITENPAQIVFVVEPTYAGKAIGRNGINVRKLENALNRKIKIVEFNPEILDFIRNLIYPLKARELSFVEGVVTVTAENSQTRGYLIGRNASNLRNYEDIIKRYFEIKELKVA